MSIQPFLLFKALASQGFFKISFLNDLRAIPFAIVCAFLGWQIIHMLAYRLHSLVKRARNDETLFNNGSTDDVQLPGLSNKIKRHVTYFGGYTIVGFMFARLLGSSVLWILSRRTVQTTCDATFLVKCPEVFLTMTFVSRPRNPIP